MNWENMRGDPYLAPSVEIVHKDHIDAFTGSRRVVILLLGSTSARAFLLPIVHHFARRLGDKVRFGYLMAEGLHDRAGLLPHVGRVFAEEARRPRAARRGYYLFLDGQTVAFHRGLNDPKFAPLMGTIMEAIPSQKQSSETLHLFQQAINEIALSVIGRFDPVLFPGEAPRREEQEGRTRTNPYEVLGLPETATDAEIKRAYRTKLRESHPDLVETHSAEVRQLAQERSQRIIRAYRQISQSRHPRPA